MCGHITGGGNMKFVCLSLCLNFFAYIVFSLPGPAAKQGYSNKRKSTPT